jgi:hypothetical protein
MVIRGLAALGCGLLVAAAACGTPGSGQQGEAATGGGDIPDSQAYVEYAPPDGPYTLKVPEGWARTEQTGTVTFTDKLNRVQVSTLPEAAAPTVDSVRARELPAIQAAAKGFRSASVTAVSRSGGAAVLVAYETDSPPDPVTGKVVRDTVQRFEFWRNGTEAVLVLTSPVGADNTDPWRTVSDSYRWR